MFHRFSEKRLICFSLVALNALVFGQTAGFPFLQYDDSIYVTSNSHVLSGISWANIHWAFTTLEAGFWHPLTWLSLIVDGQLYGSYAGGYHWTNVLLHMGNTLLLFLVLSRMTGSAWRSGLVAALFAVHPLHVEPVAWIASRKDVLFTFFWMLTLMSYVWYVERPDWRRYGSVLFFFAMGLMSKPMIVTLPLVLILIDYWPLKRIGGEALFAAGRLQIRPVLTILMEKVPLCIMALLSFVVTFNAVSGMGALAAPGALPWYDRTANGLLSYVSYIMNMIWPINLAVFYPHPGRWPWFFVFPSFLLLSCLTVAALWLHRRYPHLTVGWFWYLITLIPVIGIIQVGAHAMADRYTYIPLIGLFWAAVWSIPERVNHAWRRGVTLAVMLVVAALTFTAWRQTSYWQSDLVLFRHALAVTRSNYVAESNLAGALGRQGQSDEAMGHFQRAVIIKPNYEPAYYGMGMILQTLGRTDEAMRCYEQVLAIEPRFSAAHVQLGHLYLQLQQYANAADYLRNAVELLGKKDAPWNMLGIVLMKQKKYDDALIAFREAAQQQPYHAGIRNNFAMALLAVGRTEEAVTHFREAIRLEPDYANAHYELSVILREKGLLDEAERHRLRAVSINPEYGQKK